MLRNKGTFPSPSHDIALHRMNILPSMPPVLVKDAKPSPSAMRDRPTWKNSIPIIPEETAATLDATQVAHQQPPFDLSWRFVDYLVYTMRAPRMPTAQDNYDNWDTSGRSNVTGFTAHRHGFGRRLSSRNQMLLVRHVQALRTWQMLLPRTRRWALADGRP